MLVLVPGILPSEIAIPTNAEIKALATEKEVTILVSVFDSS